MVAHQGTDHMSEIDYIYLKLLEGVAKGFDYEKLAESCLVLGNEILGDDITELLNEHMSEVELGLDLDIDIENIKGEVL